MRGRKDKQEDICWGDMGRRYVGGQAERNTFAHISSSMLSHFSKTSAMWSCTNQMVRSNIPKLNHLHHLAFSNRCIAFIITFRSSNRKHLKNQIDSDYANGNSNHLCIKSRHDCECSDAKTKLAKKLDSKCRN